MLETVKITPAGHKRAPQVIPIRGDSTMQELLERWKLFKSVKDKGEDMQGKRTQSLRQQMIACIKGCHPSLDEIHAFLLHPDVRKDDVFKYFAGDFASVLYRRLPVVTFDVILPELNYAAQDYEGLFINKGQLGSYATTRNGVLVNYGIMKYDCCMTSSVGYNAGVVGNFFGFQNSKVLINDGVTGEYFTALCSGFAILLQEPKDIRETHATVLRGEQISEELGGYIRKLDETCRGTREGIMAEYGPHPSATIQRQLGRILGVKL